MAQTAPSDELPKFIVRLPPDLKAWVADQARQNASSQNSEIVRALRERQQRQVEQSCPQPIVNAPCVQVGLW